MYKFRTWDCKNKKMKRVMSVSKDFFTWKDDSGTLKKSSNFNFLMPYTEYKDINRKDIYDKDIVKVYGGIKSTDCDGFEFLTIDKSCFVYGKVYWDEIDRTYCVVGDNNGKHVDAPLGDIHFKEVVGDIYENHNLLETEENIPF